MSGRDEAREDAKTAKTEINQLETRISELTDDLFRKAEAHLEELQFLSMRTGELLREIGRLRAMRGADLSDVGYYDGATYHGGVLERAKQQKREQAEKARVKALRAPKLAAELEAALRGAERGSVLDMRRVVALLGEKHSFTAETRTVMPEGAVAFADWSKRLIVVPPIVDEETFAVALHEAGHILAGECTLKEPHRPNRSVARWHHCLACETDAWEHAMRLVPFSREMHARLRRSLHTYRRMTPASSSEVARLDRLAGTVTLYELMMGRMRWQERWDLVRQWREEATRQTPSERRWALVREWQRG